MGIEHEIENEKEWRRYLTDKLETIEQRLIVKVEYLDQSHDKLRDELVAIKTWLWIWRGFGAIVLGALLSWIKDHIR